MAKRGNRTGDAHQTETAPPESAAGSASVETGPETARDLGAVDPAAAPLADAGDPGATLSDPPAADERPSEPAQEPAGDAAPAEALAEALAAARAELEAATEARRVLGDPDAEIERLSAELRAARQEYQQVTAAASKKVDHLMQEVRFETERRQQKRLVAQRAEARIAAARAEVERLTGGG